MNPFRWVGKFLCLFRTFHWWRVTDCDGYSVACCRLCGHSEEWRPYPSDAFWAMLRGIERQIVAAADAEADSHEREWLN